MTGTKILASIVVMIVITSIVSAVLIMEPPSQQRKRKLDTRRVNDLQNITRGVETYWKRHKAIPPNLNALSKDPGSDITFTDPATSVPYGYEVTGSKSYKLCATFETDSSSNELQPYNGLGIWGHAANLQCFEQTLSCVKSGRCD